MAPPSGRAAPPTLGVGTVGAVSDGWNGGGDLGTGWVPPPGSGYGPAPGYGYGPPAYGPPPRTGKRFGWGSIAIAFLVGGFAATVVLVGAIVLIGTNLPSNVAGTHKPIDEGSTSARVGDCLEGTPGRAEVSTRDQVVDCDELHGSEVIGIIEAPDAPNPPGDGTWSELVDGVCPIAFQAYVGADDDSFIEWRAIVPSDEAWAAGDRSVYCLADATDHAGGSESVEGVGGD